MTFHHPQAFIFVPTGEDPSVALARTTDLSIGAHPDDLEFMSMHGIENCFQKKERFFTGIVVTNGAGSVKSGPLAGITSKELVERRIEEQKEAARIGKYNALIMLCYESAELKTSTPWNQRPLIQDLQNLFSACNPHTVYSHNPFDKHPTHRAIIVPLIQLLQSFPPEKKPKRVYGCEVWRGLDWVPEQDRITLPLQKSDLLSEKLNQVFRTQIEAGKNYAEAIRGRRIANATFTDPHSIDSASQIEIALDLTDLIQQTPDQIMPYFSALLNRFQNRLLNDIQNAL